MLLKISLKNESLFTSRNIWHKLCIPASSWHALINGAFGVLFKKRGRSVCVWSQSLFCLFVFIPFHKKFWRSISGDISLKSLSALAIPWVRSVSYLAEKAENWEFVSIKNTPTLDTLKRRGATRKKTTTKLLFSQAVLNRPHKHYTTYRITRCQKSMLLSVWISSRPKIAVRTENNS